MNKRFKSENEEEKHSWVHPDVRAVPHTQQAHRNQLLQDDMGA